MIESSITNENENGQRVTYSHDLFVNEALGFIRENKDKPFFLYLPVTIPHTELASPPEMLAKYSGKFEETVFPSVEGHPPVQQPKAEFAAMVATLDRDVGRLRQLVKELGLAENTLIIFTSDNGPASEQGAEPETFNGSGELRGHKRDLYEGGIRVPFIAAWPAQIPSQHVDSSSQITFWDVLPTLAEIAETPVPDNVDGISFLSAMRGDPLASEQRFLYWEFLHEGEGRLMQAGRLNNFKGVRHAPNRPIELYDLGNDLSESVDIAEKHPEIIAQLEVLFRQSRGMTD